MPVLEFPQLIFLGSVLVAFGAFTFTLIGVSLYMLIPRSPGDREVAREVIQAKRADAARAR